MTYFERDTALKAQKSDIYSLHSNIKVSRACTSIRYNGIPYSGWKKIYGILSPDNRTVIDKIKFFATLTILKQIGLHVTKDLAGSLLIKALTGLQLILQQTVILILILLALKDL